MKLLLLLLAICLLLIIFILWKRANTKAAIPIEFVTIESKGQSDTYLPVVSISWLSELEQKYKGKDYEEYPNEYHEITEKLCNEVYSNSKYWENGETHAEFLHQLTKEQRTLFALVNFEGQVNNGGVYQFLFNQPELTLVGLEAMKIAGIDRLASDYEIVLHELFGKFETIAVLRNTFQDNKQNWRSRWNAFADGYKELPAAEVIEAYFYETEFKRIFRSKVVNYIKANQAGLFKVKK